MSETNGSSEVEESDVKKTEDALAPECDLFDLATPVGVPGDAGPITLNVGGVVYATSLSTLTRFPDSMLARMFDGGIPSTKDDSGAFFIDRDGEMFRHVLNFLRDGDLLLPFTFSQFPRLKREAEFFCLDALADAVDAVSDVEAMSADPFLVAKAEEMAAAIVRFRCRKNRERSDDYDGRRVNGEKELAYPVFY